MSKRSVTELQPVPEDGQAYLKASGSGSKREAVNPDEMGEFEDAWEDDIESDEEDVNKTAEHNDGVCRESIYIYLS